MVELPYVVAVTPVLASPLKNVVTLPPRPLTPVLIGNPVALVKIAYEGVPILGVNNTGLVPKTKAPVPVSSVIAPAKLELEGVAKKVAIPEPRPLIPVETGKPVAFVNVTDCGVPKIGVTNVGLLLKTTLAEPVLSVSANPKFALVGVARNVVTFAAKPVIPVLNGNPVALVSTA